MRALLARVSPIRVCAVTLLPEPGLADDRHHLAGAQVEADPVDGLDDAVFGREADPQVAD